MNETRPSPWEPAAAPAEADRRLHAPAVARNRDAIRDTLRPRLPLSGLILEIASGSGEHIVHFAEALPALRFQPSDPSPEALASIAAWTAQAGATNVLPPLRLDAAEQLILYGPFRRPGRPLEPGNAAFDESLRERNPAWGLRDLGEVTALASGAGFGEPEVIEMPANNLTVVFGKQAGR
ncbi:MAG: hypothetical protein B7Z14_08085 [Bosea sp. 32-68-6]|nr:MAG: hypothetical protein B7Z14_08085 [Bosea sp. 32-68-6]